MPRERTGGVRVLGTGARGAYRVRVMLVVGGVSVFGAIIDGAKREIIRFCVGGL